MDSVNKFRVCGLNFGLYGLNLGLCEVKNWSLVNSYLGFQSLIFDFVLFFALWVKVRDWLVKLDLYGLN